MQLGVVVSRMHQGRLKSVRIFTSDNEPDEIENEGDGPVIFYGRPLLSSSDVFENEEYSLVPELRLELVRNDQSPPEACINADFSLYQPQADCEAMQLDQLLRYLEYCVPW